MTDDNKNNRGSSNTKQADPASGNRNEEQMPSHQNHEHAKAGVSNHGKKNEQGNEDDE